MKITSIEEDGNGSTMLDGTSYTVNLSLIEEPTIGDYVIVHAGFAIEKLDVEEADARLKLFSEMAESQSEALKEQSDK